MKITIVQGAFLPVPPTLGGAVEKMWFALGKNFAEKGHQVVHLSRNYTNMPGEEWIDGVHHKRIKGYATPSNGIKLKMLDLLYSLRARSVVPADSDIIVTNTFWAPIIFPRKLKQRCMVDVQRMPKGQMRWYKHASRLRANSSSVALAISEEIPSAEHRRIKTIPNPLPFQDLPEVDFSLKKKVILFTGRLHPEKGLDLLINAFKMVEPGWKLKIVGPSNINAGGGGPDYLETLKALAGQSDIEFTGPLYDPDLLNQQYKEASIFVYPSVAEKGETFGLAPLEAMAWGSVPIVSRLTCFGDFIEHEKNGLVFDHRHVNATIYLKEAIERLQQDKSLMNDLSRAALLVRNTHSTSYIASLFIKDFEQLLKNL